jgi:hypothetical protein
MEGQHTTWKAENDDSATERALIVGFEWNLIQRVVSIVAGCVSFGGLMRENVHITAFEGDAW